MTGSLDPEDWGAFRALCHTAVDDIVDWWEGVRDRPVWQPMPEAAKVALIGPPPRSGQDPQDVYRRFVELMLPYPNGNTHPGFMGWVHGSGTPIGALAEFLAGALNANLGGREHAAVYVERQVIDWARQLFRLPDTASGILVNGTSMATVLALAAARQAYAGGDVRREGLQERAPGSSATLRARRMAAWRKRSSSWALGATVCVSCLPMPSTPWT